jgi:alkyl hydroperoxide reductase subunit AhpC
VNCIAKIHNLTSIPTVCPKDYLHISATKTQSISFNGPQVLQLRQKFALTMVQSSGTPLRIGSTVPDFNAETTQGRINFYEQINNNWAVLFAFPDDFTPVATTELVSFTEHQSEFAQRHVKLFALSTNNTRAHHGDFEDHSKWVQDINEISTTPLLFPIICDDDGTISMAFNVLERADAEAVRADDAVGEGLAFDSRTVFVIDNQKRLRLVLNYPAAVGFNTNEVLRVVDCLQTAQRADVRTPANWIPGKIVVVPPKYDDETAHRKFPEFKALKPYLRFYALPEEKTNVAHIQDVSDGHTAQYLALGADP